MKDRPDIDWTAWSHGRDFRVPERPNTAAENAVACRENLATARKALQHAHIAMSRAESGSLELSQARRAAALATSDIRHWEGYVTYWDVEAAKERAAVEAADRNRRALALVEEEW